MNRAPRQVVTEGPLTLCAPADHFGARNNLCQEHGCTLPEARFLVRALHRLDDNLGRAAFLTASWLRWDMLTARDWLARWGWV